MSEATDTAGATGIATSVRLTYDEGEYPEDVRGWVHEGVTDETFLASFRRRHDTMAEGEIFDEFVSCGCGSPRDVTLRVVAVDGGPRVDEGTELVVEPTG
ncbi:hypothetical protein [Haloglomus halophilum]|uniref:hypothetical protein n=1 Tax=Haloglomus halophilum TaxID=2962672 RepID=UPI0020C94032|nr:hypothetical protein [Haloglomus halophilum]